MPRIRLRNSVVQGNTPNPANIEIGEVCINAHPDTAALYFKDVNDDLIELRPGSVVSGDAGPTNPTEGQLWYDTLNDTLNYWDGTGWVELGTAANEFWDRTGTVVSPTNDGDSLVLTNGGTAGVSLDPRTAGSPLVRDANGRLLVGRPAVISDVTTQAAETNGDVVINSRTTGAGQTASLNLYHLVDGTTVSRSGGRISSVAEGAYTAGVATSSDSALTFSTTRNATLGEKARIDSAGVFTLGNGTTNAVTLDPGTTGGPLVRDPNGRLLVGTASGPSAGFHNLVVQGYKGTPTGGGYAALQVGVSASSGLAAASDIGILSFTDNQATSFASISCKSDGVSSATSAAGRLEFYTTPSGSTTPEIRATIDSDGRLLMGAESSTATATAVFEGNSANASGAGTVFLSRDITPNAANQALGELFYQGQNNGQAARISVFSDAAWSAGSLPSHLRFYTTPSGSTTPVERMRITAAGDTLTQGGVVGNLTSDERLKTNIVDAPSQWADIKAIRLTKYQFKSDPSGATELGPIAQELEKVCPNLIIRRSATAEEIADESNSLGEGDEVLTYKMTILYMKAVGALQEAMERIETLEARLAKLEGGASTRK